MEMLFVVLVQFSGGSFQSLEVVEAGFAQKQIDIGNKPGGCEAALAKPLALQKIKAMKKVSPSAKVAYKCLGASQVSELEALTKSAENWPAVHSHIKVK